MIEPLTGIRVLDLSRLLPGPYCTLLLADLGADVVKIEEPGKGDYMRQLMPGMYEAVNRNKRSVTVNLRSKEGCDILSKMVQRADVLVESFRPGVTAKMGIGYSDLRKINDSLIYCSISGYGQGGPHRNSPGHDINYLAIAGALSVPGELNKQPTRPGLPIVDLSAGLFAAFSILASVRLREKTGKGQYIDAAMTDGLISWMSVRAGDFLLGGKMPRKAAEMGHLSPCNAMFQTKDKQKITVGAVEDHFWKRLCEALDLREWLQGEDYATYLMRVKKGRKVYKRLQDTFLTKTRDEWLKILNDAGVPCSPVYSYEETFEDPHIKQRNLLVEIPYGEKKKLKQVVFPIKFSEYTPKIYLPPPSLGEHTEAVLLEAGFSEEEIMAFRTRRAI